MRSCANCRPYWRPGPACAPSAAPGSTPTRKPRPNEVLLGGVANMVVEALPELRTPDHPARHFDYLPARGREASNFADKYLTREIPSLARYADCIPDADGI